MATAAGMEPGRGTRATAVAGPAGSEGAGASSAGGVLDSLLRENRNNKRVDAKVNSFFAATHPCLQWGVG